MRAIGASRGRLATEGRAGAILIGTGERPDIRVLCHGVYDESLTGRANARIRNSGEALHG
jgi:hypothetical protein